MSEHFKHSYAHVFQNLARIFDFVLGRFVLVGNK